METSQIRRLVPIPEARQRLGGIANSTIYELVNRGELVKVNIGRRGFITAGSIDAYVDRLTAARAIDERSPDRGRPQEAVMGTDGGGV